MTTTASKTGISREVLCKALAQGGNTSLDTVLKLSMPLGLKLIPSGA